MEKEEGEMSDIEDMVIDEEELVEKNDPGPGSTLVYKAEKDGIIVQHQEKVDALKLEERAKRFGLNLAGSRVVTQKQIDELYEKSGIKNGNERHFRFDTIHLNGIDGLTTREIFEYLEDYKPLSLERVNDTSCNVVCQDHIAAALALLVHSREIRSEELKAMLSDKLEHWREGMPHPKKDLILMRFATNGDKKVTKNKPAPKSHEEYIDESMDPISKNPWGDLCKSWGVYDHQEIFLRKVPNDGHEENSDELEGRIKIHNKRLAKRLGKRSIKKDSEDSNSDTEWTKKSKIPRMRMHADDEESKMKKEIKNESEDDIPKRDACNRDTYQPLSIEVVNSRIDYVPRETSKLSDKFNKRHRSIKDSEHVPSRLGKFEYENTESYGSDSNSSDGVEHNVMSRINKVRSKSNPVSSVWNRLEVKDRSPPPISSNQKDLRQYLRVKKEKISDDLRNKIKKTKGDVMLRIEIDNNSS